MLPHLDCGLCGFESCGQFAKAVSEGRASSFGCRRNPWAGYRIGEIMGKKALAFGYHTPFVRPHFETRMPHGSVGSLRAEVHELSERMEGILERIDSLSRKVKRQSKTIKKGGDHNATRRRNRPARSRSGNGQGNGSGRRRPRQDGRQWTRCGRRMRMPQLRPSRYPSERYSLLSNKVRKMWITNDKMSTVPMERYAHSCES